MRYIIILIENYHTFIWRPQFVVIPSSQWNFVIKAFDVRTKDPGLGQLYFLILRLVILTQYQLVIDGRTNGLTIRYDTIMKYL